MAHGTPDWGVTAGAVTTYQLTDLAELAARLGSIDTFDRRGDVAFLDSFAGGLGKWATSYSGTGGGVELSAAEARSGLYCAHPTAGSDASANAILLHAMPLPALFGVGFEYSFRLVSTILRLGITVVLFTGTRQLLYQVRWVDADDALEYLDSNAQWQVLATGVNLRQSASHFHTMKLVVDSAGKKYARLILDSNTYSLADIAVNDTATVVAPQLSAQVVLEGRTGNNDEIYVDDVIITQNEPV